MNSALQGIRTDIKKPKVDLPKAKFGQVGAKIQAPPTQDFAKPSGPFVQSLPGAQYGSTGPKKK